MTAVNFTKKDFNNIELVREIVFRRLKERNWNLLYDHWEDNNAGKFVGFEDHQAGDRFYVLMQEVMWQLIIQNVITPGKDSANPELPWFRITSYGDKVLAEDRFSPHDPTGYLDEFNKMAVSEIGESARPYLEEALRCFTAGCHAASLIMVGVAAEAAFLGLCEKIKLALKSESERNKFVKKQWIKEKHKWVIKIIEGIPREKRQKLPESLDLTLTSLYDLIRRQRNEIGHPSGKLPVIDRERAFVYFRMFPSFVADVEAFAKFCDMNNL